MEPTATLKNEHQVLLLMFCQAERDVQAIERGEIVEGEGLGGMAELYAKFVLHHLKEEKYLYQTLQQRAAAKDLDPLSSILQEHEEGRQRAKVFIDVIPAAAKGDPAAIGIVKENMAIFVRSLRSHISREEDILFPLADRVLLPQDQAALVEAFKKVDTDGMKDAFRDQLGYEANGGNCATVK